MIKNWDKIKEGTLLIIDWEDIVEKSGWLGDEEAQNYPPALCKTVGWFVNDDDSNIRLTSTVANDGDKNITVIPKGVIRQVKKISYKR